MDLFHSARLKIARAEEHHRALMSELAAWHDLNPYSVVKKFDPDSGRHSQHVVISGSPPLERLALIAGDCAHNLRCALDHLIYRLSVKHSGPIRDPKIERRIQFPITDGPENFKQESSRLELISENAKQFIERKQPYHRRDPFLPPILRVLSSFDNADKHRLIHVMFSANAGGKISFLPPFPRPKPPIIWVNEPLQSGKEFVHFTIAGCKSEAQYRFQAEFCVSVGHVAGPTGRNISPLQAVMEGMIGEVKRIADVAVEL